MKPDCFLAIFAACAAMFCAGNCCTAEAASISNGDRIFWVTDFNEIVSARPDGTDLITIVNVAPNIGSVEIDATNSRVYWSSGAFISRCDLNGSNVMDIVRIPGSFFQGDMALDLSRNQMFFTDGRNHIIYRSDLDGENLTVIKPASGTPTNSGLDIWLDADKAKLYWIDGGLKRSDLSGANVETLFNPAGGVTDFEVESESGKIYWVTSTSVRRANLDGTQSEVLVSGGLRFSLGIALDRNAHQIFYTDTWGAGPTNYDSTVRAVNFDGTQARVLLNLGPSIANRPHDIAFASTVPEPTSVSLLMAAFAALPTRRCKSVPHNRV